MKKQIKFFEFYSIYILEGLVNHYLKQLDYDDEVINVQYNHYFNHKVNEIWYTAMISHWSDVKESEEKQMPLKYTAVSQPL